MQFSSWERPRHSHVILGKKLIHIIAFIREKKHEKKSKNIINLIKLYFNPKKGNYPAK